jgi:DNA-directed RNA polymerase II subunit RPB2
MDVGGDFGDPGERGLDYGSYGAPDGVDNAADEALHAETDAGSLYGDDDPDDDDSHDINEEDAWKVISSYFRERGLVRQQLDSFNRFLRDTIQELIDQSPNIELVPESQHKPGTEEYDDSRKIIVSFGQLRMGQPNFTEFNGDSPALYPNQARLRNLTYSAPLYCDVSLTDVTIPTSEEEEEVVKEHPPLQVFIGRIPIMLRSDFCLLNKCEGDKQLNNVGECHVDQGGYFVVNGSEKVLLAQERMSANHVFVFTKAMPSKYSHVAEVRSVSDVSNRPATSFAVRLLSRGGGKGCDLTGQPIVCSLPQIKQEIPIVILFRALGFANDNEMMSHICYDYQDEELMTALVPSIEEAQVIQEQDIALDFIAKRANTVGVTREKRIKYANELLQLELLPHIGTEPGPQLRKGYFIGYMVNRLLQVGLKRHTEDDRDHYGNKRVDLAGPLLAGLFRQLLRKLMKDIKANLRRAVNSGKDVNDILTTDLTASIKSSIITNGLKYALATGNWNATSGAATKTGVSQVLNRLTFASALSHLRRLNSPIGREGKLAKPRQLHNTHWGMICPAETPEGQACGLVKNLALMASISVGSPSKPVGLFLEEWGMRNLVEIATSQVAKASKVFVNGAWVGIHYYAPDLANTLRDLRRKGDIDGEVSIVMDHQFKELRIYTDAGRICRPLFIVENNKKASGGWSQPKLHITKGRIKRLLKTDDGVESTFRDLVAMGDVEYVDCEEEETIMIAMLIEDLKRENHSALYTHCEIHPAMILGVCGSIIPFPDHNQSPRNTYQSAMGKQAMGVYITNFSLRMDTQAHVLYYPQKPLVTTRAMEHLKFRALPSGINAVVAIACYSGYNQEDSVIMSQSGIDRGLFRSAYFRAISDEEKRPLAGVAERFEIPDRQECTGIKPGSYLKLDDDGIVAEATRFAANDILVGKTQPLEAAPGSDDPKGEGAGVTPAGGMNVDTLFGSKSKKDLSLAAKSTESGVVDKVMLAANEEGARFVKIRLRSIRKPQVGDKFSSRHGQKGTVGMTYRQEDMPFTVDGVIPDIIVNPHAIPSRMTIGQLIECLLGKVSAIDGTEGDATPFAKITVADISAQLLASGYQPHGWELMHNGHTGRPLEAQIFLGPTYYQRLKHMVDDKIHSRSTGPVTMLTHQPLEGRSRGGGLRFGEMERDCMISHGAAMFMKERLMDQSDAYRVHVCDLCGLIAIADLNKNVFQCRNCNNKTAISQVYIPYACKLLFQELMAMACAPRLAVLDHLAQQH